MKDMLLTYNEYNKDLGYVQGMSDLLAPIYAVLQDDAMAFWGFVKFMDRMERNFLRDQSGMRLQLQTLDHLVQLIDPQLYIHLQSADSTNFFFFFRMLLVWYKREFEWMDVLRLWEVLWTDWLSGNFHLFIAVAILEKHRDVIMEHLKHFDEVLKYSKHPKLIENTGTDACEVNELSNTIDLESTLVRAEALFGRFQRVVEAIDRQDNFPAPNAAVRRRKPGNETASDSRQTSALLVDSTSPGSSTSVSTPSDVAAGKRKSVGQTVKPSDGNSPSSSPSGKASAASERKEVSPELRALLSREVPKITKDELKEHGGGVGS
jgi:hypothetical protein